MKDVGAATETSRPPIAKMRASASFLMMVLTVLSLYINIRNSDGGFSNTIEELFPDTTGILPISVVLLFFYHYATSRHVDPAALILSAFFSACSVLGRSVGAYGSSSLPFSDPACCLALIVSFFGFLALFYFALSLAFSFFCRKRSGLSNLPSFLI